MTNIPSEQDNSRHDAEGQPELTEDDEEPKSRIKDIGGRAACNGEEDREDREDEEQEESGTVHAVTTALPDATNRSAKCAELEK